MMSDKALTIQDHFLNTVRRLKSPVTIFLIKGVKLQGVVTWFDSFSLLLRRDGQSQLVYKHGISTLVPLGDMGSLIDGLGEGGKGKGKPALQDHFLEAARAQQTPMTVYLVNGVMLQGWLAAFDQFSLALVRGDQAQLVYKHAISTLQPAEPLDLSGGADFGTD